MGLIYTSDKAWYMTGEVAKLFGVSHKLVGKWADMKVFKTSRLPEVGTTRGHLRFHWENIVANLRKCQMDSTIDSLVSGPRRTLIVGQSSAFSVAADNPYRVPTPFHAGAILATKKPAVVVFDFACGRPDCIGMARSIRNEVIRPTLIALTSEDEESRATIDPIDGLFDFVTPSPASVEFATEIMRKEAKYR